MNGTAGSEARLIWPGLRGFYDSFADIAFTLMRIVVGYNLLMHGWVKVSQAGAAGVTGYMARQGLEPGAVFAYAAMFLETVGAVCIIIGLFTRFFAAAMAIEMAIALVVVHLAKGFGVGAGGYEYVLLIGIVLLVVAMRGGGPYSVDRVIGKEL